MIAKRILSLSVATVLVCLFASPVTAQEYLPRDNGWYTYHASPRYRSSESHLLRTFTYVVHPVGWALREGIFRPLSYFVSSTEKRASIFGYREPYDYREPECFSAESSVPDCRAISPFNYDSGQIVDEPITEVVATLPAERHVYFPDVNFDFDVRKMNTLGEGKANQIARLLQEDPGVHVVLEGHADYLGSEEYNEKLGMDRAEAVRAQLVALGVSADRISTVTFGKSKPMFENETDWARAVNRRVSVHLSSEG